MNLEVLRSFAFWSILGKSRYDQLKLVLGIWMKKGEHETPTACE